MASGTAFEPTPNRETGYTRGQVKRLVRKVFDETWREYHALKPPSTIGFTNGSITASADAIEDELFRNARERRERNRAVQVARVLKRRNASTERGNDGVRMEGQQRLAADPIPTAGPSTSAHLQDGHDHPNLLIPSTSSSPPSSLEGAASAKHAVAMTSSDHRPIYKRRPNAGPSSMKHVGSKNSSRMQLQPTPTPTPRPPSSSLLSNSAFTTPPAAPASTYAPTIYRFPSSTVKAVPPYWFCVSIKKTISTDDEKILPFRHIFEHPPDSKIRQFDEAKYYFEFDRPAWEGAWRDPEVDIIQVETIRRLADYDLTPDQIDATRILPLEFRHIEALDINRDLPPFPLALSLATDPNPLKRKWEHPLETKEEVYDTSTEEYEELFCTRSDCTVAGCPRHSALDDGILIFHSHSVRPDAKLPQALYRLDPRTFFHPHKRPREPCSEKCGQIVLSTMDYKTTMIQTESWDETQNQKLVELMAAQYRDKQHVNPCVLRLAYPGFECFEIVLQISKIAKEDRYYGPRAEGPTPAPKSRVPFRPTDPSDKSKSHLECRHEGPCSAETMCNCFSERRTCGRNCGCSQTCERRFRGCRCHRPKAPEKKERTVCNPERCPCRKSNRECVPELCGTCGSGEEIAAAKIIWSGEADMAEIMHQSTAVSCGNVGIQKGIWPKLRVGISPEAGYGLFADQAIPRGVMLGEYVGEAISHYEASKRDMINAQTGRTYMFRLNGDTEIDAANYGNPMRYINAAKGAACNCAATTLAVHDESRIAFFSTRTINKHEEIRFDYGIGFDHQGRDQIAE